MAESSVFPIAYTHTTNQERKQQPFPLRLTAQATLSLQQRMSKLEAVCLLLSSKNLASD